MQRKLILTGGGTAGHATPNLALLPILQQDGFEVKYIGTKNGIERQIIERAQVPYYPISSGKLRRYFSLKNFTDPFRIARGYFQARKILRRERPAAVFSKGGFVTVPVVFAASHLHIPVVLHESDYTPGLANRLCIPRAQKVCVAFEATAKHIAGGKCVVTGSPVRSELFSGDRARGLNFLGFDGNKPLLLIMGGSLGAQAINEAVDASIDTLLAQFDIAHIRGAQKCNPALDGRAGYRQFEYLSEELPDLFAAADFMLSRAGANAVFEILALCIPALLIPLPKESSRGDQILNADFFVRSGFSHVLDQAKLTPESLVKALAALQQDAPQLRQAMRESSMGNGTQNVIDVIYSVLEKDD